MTFKMKIFGLIIGFIAILFTAIYIIDPLNRNEIVSSNISWDDVLVSKVIVKTDEIDQVTFEKKFSIEKLSDQFKIEIKEIDLSQNSVDYKGSLLGFRLKAKGTIYSKVKENNLEYKFDGYLGYYNSELDEFRFKPVSASLLITNQKQDNQLIFKSYFSVKEGNLNVIEKNLKYMFPAFLFFKEQLVLRAIK